MVDLNGLLDLDTSDGREFISPIQGNLLKEYGRDHTAHISLTFAADSAAPRDRTRQQDHCRRAPPHGA